MIAILKQFQAIPPPASVKAIEEICVTCGGAHPYYQCSGCLPGNTIANPKGKLKSITTQSGLVLDGPSVPMPPPFINPEDDERVEETLTDPELEYFLNHDPIEEMDSIIEDSVDKNSPDDNLVDTLSEIFTDEHALDYSSPPLWDDYDDELFDL
ncbi:hypothetical protein Tco_1089453 [Tanacetum coccineum]